MYISVFKEAPIIGLFSRFSYKIVSITRFGRQKGALILLHYIADTVSLMYFAKYGLIFDVSQVMYRYGWHRLCYWYMKWHYFDGAHSLCFIVLFKICDRRVVRLISVVYVSNRARLKLSWAVFEVVYQNKIKIIKNLFASKKYSLYVRNSEFAPFWQWLKPLYHLQTK